MLILDCVLFLAACLGHAALWIYCLNWIYALPLPRKLQKAMRLMDGVLIWAGPAAVALVYGWRLTEALAQTSFSEWHSLLVAYVSVCWVVGLGILPVVTLRRGLRRPPALLLGNHTKTI